MLITASIIASTGQNISYSIILYFNCLSRCNVGRGKMVLYDIFLLMPGNTLVTISSLLRILLQEYVSQGETKTPVDQVCCNFWG